MTCPQLWSRRGPESSGSETIKTSGSTTTLLLVVVSPAGGSPWAVELWGPRGLPWSRSTPLFSAWTSPSGWWQVSLFRSSLKRCFLRRHNLFYTCLVWSGGVGSVCHVSVRWLDRWEELSCLLHGPNGQYPGLLRPSSSSSSSSVCWQLCGHVDPCCDLSAQISLHRPPGVSPFPPVRSPRRKSCERFLCPIVFRC